MSKARGRAGPSRSRTQGAWRALHASDRGRRYALALRVLGRRREQHLARSLLQHVLGRRADLGRLGGAVPTQPGATENLRRRLAADHDRLGIAEPRRLDDSGADLAGANRLGADGDVLVLLGDFAGALERAAGFFLQVRRQLGV